MCKKYNLISVVVLFITFGLSIMIYKQIEENKKVNTNYMEDYKQLVISKVTELERENIGLIINNQRAFLGNDSLTTFGIQDVSKIDRIYFYFLKTHVLLV